jgi:Flp pilus assembly protein TadD
MPDAELNNQRISSERRYWRGILIAAALFVLCRIIFYRQLANTPVMKFLVLDSEFYYYWAQRLAAGFGHPTGPFWLSPLYPIALAGLFKAFGSGLVGLVVVAQMILSVGTLAVILHVTRALFGNVAAITAGILAALYGPWLYYDGVLLSAGLILFLNALVILLIVTKTQVSVPGANTMNRVPTLKEDAIWLAIGLLCGLSALARPSVLVFGVALVVWLALRKELGRWRRAVFLVAAMCIPLVPVLVRNYQVSGSWMLTTSSGGVNFFIGNRAGASGLYDELDFINSFDPQREAEGYRAEAAKRLGHPVTLTQASRYWGGQAFDDMVHNPGGWLRLMLRKLWLTVQREELPNNLSFRGVAGFAPILGALPVRWGLLFPLALTGALMAWRKRRDTRVLWIYGACYVAVNLLFFSSSEYRFPLLVILLPAAGCFVVELWREITAHDYRKLAVTCVIYVLALFVCNFPSRLVSKAVKPNADYCNMATTAVDRNLPVDALPLFARALAVDPTSQNARLGLAGVLWKTGNYDDARQEFARAGVPAPDSLSGAPLQNFLREIESHIEMRDDDGAYALLDASFPADQDAPKEIWALRATIEKQRGHYDRAAFALIQASRKDPDSPEWPYRAGLMVQMMGDSAGADSLFGFAIRKYPAYAPARVALGLSALARHDTLAARAQFEQLKQISIPDADVKEQVQKLAILLHELYVAGQ